MRGILTPEQQARFDAMKALREEGGPMGGPGGFGPSRGHRGTWPGADTSQP